MKTKSLSKLVIIAALAAATAGCATQQQNNAAVGAGGGAVAGAGLGALIGGGRGAAVGAGLGAAAGGIVGYNWNKVKNDVAQSGAKDLGIDVSEQADGSLRVNIPAGVSFDTSSFALKPALLPVLDSVARTMQQSPELRARSIGHTDSTGQASYNQTLSQNRANAVTNYLTSKGVTNARLSAEGRGSNDPVADNGTVEGRAANRRIEIFLYAVKQG